MFLEEINSPADLRKLKEENLIALASEIRQRIVEVVSLNGGHLASSLGAVELIIALHYCLNTPSDKIIFDVGHQAYAHKIITGRKKEFSTLRQFGGLSGFPSKDESTEYDIFTVGHSSSAVSLALGLACARDNLPSKERFKIVAVIGDGSLSGGLCFEGLNNAGHLKKDILVILNTNELSIAPNVGAISNYLNKIISLPVYNHFRDSLVNFLSSRGPRAERVLKLANKFEEGLKGLFVPGVLFEELGFRYFGPLNGHNSGLLIHSLKNILSIKGPRILHIVTKKGKGYFAAEAEPVRFHGTGPFDIQTGAPLTKPGLTKTYTDIFGEKLIELAKSDNKIVAVTAAMPEGTSLDKFRDAFPERFFDVGIAEAHAVSFCAGLARGGLKPVLALYSTFMQRAYDQIIEDVALQKLPVIFCIDRAGIVGEDGVTHQGIFDISFLNAVPGLINMSPADAEEFKEMLEFAFEANKAVTIRYPRSNVFYFTNRKDSLKIELGKSEILRQGKDFAMVALGSMVSAALSAAEILLKQGLSGEVINARFINPLDTSMLQSLEKRFKFIFTLEEGIIDSGFGSLVESVIGRPVVKIGLPRQFIPHGKREELLGKFGLSKEAIADKVTKVICQK
ncbi:MAG: 1-deoxy-D-xylulose-5-phosphate synthase [Candidatus Omnitrophica bacterium]|nr:1-deoxy-D-xylulose-5-phosphate synthase [Candidatus Omnitrophota bacterium]